MTVDGLAHALDLRVGACRRSDVCKLLGTRDAMKLHDATVDVVTYEVVAIINCDRELIKIQIAYQGVIRIVSVAILPDQGLISCHIA